MIFNSGPFFASDQLRKQSNCRCTILKRNYSVDKTRLLREHSQKLVVGGGGGGGTDEKLSTISNI